MARSIFCSRLKRKERNHRPMVLLRKYGHRWLIPSRHYRTVNPLSIALFSGEELFSYPGLKEGKKCPIRLVGGGQCQFFLFISSQAPYPYLFLGWHNKERWCQERTHTHHFLKVRDRQGAPIDVKTWLHWTGTTICLVGSYHSSLVCSSSASLALARL